MSKAKKRRGACSRGGVGECARQIPASFPAAVIDCVSFVDCVFRGVRSIEGGSRLDFVSKRQDRTGREGPQPQLASELAVTTRNLSRESFYDLPGLRLRLRCKPRRALCQTVGVENRKIGKGLIKLLARRQDSCACRQLRGPSSEFRISLLSITRSWISTHYDLGLWYRFTYRIRWRAY